MSQAVNLRNKAVPKLPDKLCGNFLTVTLAQIEPSEGVNIDLQGFFTVLRDSVTKNDSDYAKALTSGGKEYDDLKKPFPEHIQRVMYSDVNFYTVSSWCNFPFNKADFGWGKPVWKSTGKCAAQNLVIMIDDQEGDGVEAWVHLDEKRMHQLEQNPDIKAYAV
ncbi:pelargonidin 3-O-(6-caffeoylglucoside) 5-O-(6-O-malonylglucoside) 4'''-malonyltransferase-like protein [Tanacetum coccineum]